MSVTHQWVALEVRFEQIFTFFLNLKLLLDLSIQMSIFTVLLISSVTRAVCKL